MINYYLCKEHDEFFTVKATSFVEAQEFAEMYGGVAIRALSSEEMESMTTL